MKVKDNLVGLVIAGVLTLTGCSKNTDKGINYNSPNQTIYITTAKKVEIRPHYSGIFPTIDKIVVIKSECESEGCAKISNEYSTNDPEFKVFRDILTIKR